MFLGSYGGTTGRSTGSRRASRDQPARRKASISQQSYDDRHTPRSWISDHPEMQGMTQPARRRGSEQSAADRYNSLPSRGKGGYHEEGYGKGYSESYGKGGGYTESSFSGSMPELAEPYDKGYGKGGMAGQIANARAAYGKGAMARKGKPSRDSDFSESSDTPRAEYHYDYHGYKDENIHYNPDQMFGDTNQDERDMAADEINPMGAFSYIYPVRDANDFLPGYKPVMSKQINRIIYAGAEDEGCCNCKWLLQNMAYRRPSWTLMIFYAAMSIENGLLVCFSAFVLLILWMPGITGMNATINDAVCENPGGIMQAFTQIYNACQSYQGTVQWFTENLLFEPACPDFFRLTSICPQGKLQGTYTLQVILLLIFGSMQFVISLGMFLAMKSLVNVPNSDLYKQDESKKCCGCNLTQSFLAAFVKFFGPVYRLFRWFSLAVVTVCFFCVVMQLDGCDKTLLDRSHAAQNYLKANQLANCIYWYVNCASTGDPCDGGTQPNFGGTLDSVCSPVSDFYKNFGSRCFNGQVNVPLYTSITADKSDACELARAAGKSIFTAEKQCGNVVAPVQEIFSSNFIKFVHFSIFLLQNSCLLPKFEFCFLGGQSEFRV